MEGSSTQSVEENSAEGQQGHRSNEGDIQQDATETTMEWPIAVKAGRFGSLLPETTVLGCNVAPVPAIHRAIHKGRYCICEERRAMKPALIRNAWNDHPQTGCARNISLGPCTL
mmetsp:Transcript_24605/g.68597  ORF Transcript_24605/g.68597 Transcript_24605/m.68597 type:complete len:114 (-) Transcript_24605:979-1320(-)